MSFSVSHWSGRLGNNIQQVANCIMCAEKNKGVFEQTLDHDIISKFSLSFGEFPMEASGRFYSWEPLVHCEKGIYEGGNEIGVEKEKVYDNMARICKEYVRPNLKLPEKDCIGDNTIVMHLRSGDNYHRIFDPPTNYIPNPLIFYLNLIESFDKCILITEPDRKNPIVHELAKIDKVEIQSSTVEDDFALLMNAENVALSGVGTFAMAAALCSSEIKNLYTTDLLLTEHLNYSMLFNTDVDVHVMELENYLPVFPCSWKNTEEQRKFIMEYR
tara:strand:+ start:1081 stop:1896 length:816 start_codon:yes stop_codon:yes gene_type:complete